MNRQIWSQLAIFQSFDLVQREFVRRHERELNTERTWEFLSAFVQGREYFASAANAAEAVRPLLLYYGVLSLSRALIIFLKGVSEATLAASHGLMPNGWEQTLKGGTSEVLNLALSINRHGTFPELTSATENSVVITLRTHDEGVVIVVLYPPLGATEQTSVSLDDVVSREHTLAYSYQHVTGRSSNCTIGEIKDMGDGFLVRAPANSACGIFNQQDVRLKFNVPQEINIARHAPDDRYPIPSFEYRLPHNYAALSPIPENGSAKVTYLITPWSNGGYVSPLLRCYMESYFLGMLARYYPSKWMSLLGNRKGDLTSPLLRELTQHVEDEFPQLLYSELMGRPD